MFLKNNYFQRILAILFYLFILLIPIGLYTYLYSNKVPIQNSYTNVLFIILLSFSFIILIIEFISAIKISDSTFDTFYLSLMLFGFLILSKYSFFFDLNLLDYKVISIFHFIFLIFFLFFMGLFFFKTHKIKFKKIDFSVLCLLILCIVSNTVLTFFNLEYIATILLIVIFSIEFVRVSITKFKSKITLNEFACFSITFIFLSSEIVTSLEDIIDISYNYINLTLFFLVFVFFSFIYIDFAIRSSKNNINVLKYKLEIEKNKNRMLKSQIDSHFMFNTLNLIKNTYHENNEIGDYTIDLYSKILRNNLNMLNEDLVPFETELENISNFIELEKLSQVNNINVIYDIEYSDFKIPPLSIEVFVENSIKHSKFFNKDDGLLEIQAYKKKKKIEIVIKDNGVGFNKNEIKNTSKGIKNATERLQMTLDAKVIINSKINKGTEIIITIPGENL